MRIAVTGAMGFIGGHVARELQRRGVQPTLVRRRGGAVQEGVGRWVAMDLSDADEGTYRALGSPETLVHLAWGGLPNYKSRHHFENELPVQYAFLKRMALAGVRHVVVAGTCLEYGLQSGELHEDLPAMPTTPYGFAKNALRIELEFLQRDVPFGFTWARLFYLYGDGQSSASLLPQLQAAVERGDHSFDMTGGEQIRDFLAVEEAAASLVALALNEAPAGIVNVCSGRPISVARLVEEWVREHGWAITLNRGKYAYPDYEPMAFWGDRRKLDRTLGTDRNQ